MTLLVNCTTAALTTKCVHLYLKILAVLLGTQVSTYGDRAFQNAAPKLWNNLLNCIRECDTLTPFKSKLKHYLFVETYKRI